MPVGTGKDVSTPQREEGVGGGGETRKDPHTRHLSSTEAAEEKTEKNHTRKAGDYLIPSFSRADSHFLLSYPRNLCLRNKITSNSCGNTKVITKKKKKKLKTHTKESKDTRLTSAPFRTRGPQNTFYMCVSCVIQCLYHRCLSIYEVMALSTHRS